MDIYRITGAGMQVGNRQLEHTSINIANATTVGFRRRVDLQPPILEILAKSGSGRLENGMPHVNTQPSAVTSTGRALDLAISKENIYFGLSDGEQTWLTRSGSFRVDNEGYLTGELGLKLQGHSGNIRVPTPDVEVSSDGTIRHDGMVLDKVQLYRPSSNSMLFASLGTLLKSSSESEKVAESNAIRAKFLENSNTSSSAAVLEIMKLGRQYEGLVRLTQGYDDVLGRAIQKLGDF